MERDDPRRLSAVKHDIHGDVDAQHAAQILRRMKAG
jgi:hypothetical protein